MIDVQFLAYIVYLPVQSTSTLLLLPPVYKSLIARLLALICSRNAPRAVAEPPTTAAGLAGLAAFENHFRYGTQCSNARLLILERGANAARWNCKSSKARGELAAESLGLRSDGRWLPNASPRTGSGGAQEAMNETTPQPQR